MPSVNYNPFSLRSPAPPEPVHATPDEIEALKAAGFKLSRKERRAEEAQRRVAQRKGKGKRG